MICAVAVLMVCAPCAAQKAAETTAKAKKADIYDENADAKALVADALMKARRDHTRVLIMFGGNWCGWCHKLHDVFRGDSEIAHLLRYEYQLVMVDTKAKNADVLMKEYEVDQNEGVPYLVVLDGGGKVVTRQETGSLEEGDHHVPAKVKAFLSKHVDAAPPAQSVLDAAIARARSEDKRVFLHFGAPWCGWCHKLDDFLAMPEVAKIIGVDFVDVKIDVDRMEGGKELMAKYNESPGGIPWFVFLDAQGEALAQSGAGDQNIGYPLEPGEIAAFMAVIRKAARKTDDAQFATIERALQEQAKRIKAPREEGTGEIGSR
jgi:thioredoxin-related protein